MTIRTWMAAAAGLAIFAAFGSAPASAAPILQGTATSLTGVSGIEVNGSLYDATFQDGTCATVYGVCDVAHFTFTTEADALSASSALLGAIAGTYFDSNIGTVGCNNNTGNCLMLTPFAASSGSFTDAEAANRYLGADLTLTVGPNSNALDTSDPFDSGSISLVWVVWSPSTAVPEPVTLSIFGAGLAGAVAMRRRKKPVRA